MTAQTLTQKINQLDPMKWYLALVDDVNCVATIQLTNNVPIYRTSHFQLINSLSKMGIEHLQKLNYEITFVE